MMLAAAPSKVPFYIAGGVLVAWAVLVAAWGISHAEFPGSPSRARVVLLASFLLVAATMTAAVLTGGEGAEHAAAAPAAPRATGRDLALAADSSGALRFDKTRAAVLAGRVTVKLTNDSPVDHNLTVARGSETLGATKTISKSTDTTTVELTPGDYVFFCSVVGHRAAGMEGTLTVE